MRGRTWGYKKRCVGGGVGKIQQPAVLLHTHTLHPSFLLPALRVTQVSCSVPTASHVFSAFIFSFYASASRPQCLHAPCPAAVHSFSLPRSYMSQCTATHTHIGVKRSSPLTSTHSASFGTSGLDRLTNCLAQPTIHPPPLLLLHALP